MLLIIRIWAIDDQVLALDDWKKLVVGRIYLDFPFTLASKKIEIWGIPNSVLLGMNIGLS